MKRRGPQSGREAGSGCGRAQRRLSGPAKLDAFLDRYDPAFAVVAGSGAIADGFGGVSRIPTLFVFDRDGRIVYDFVNARGAARTSVSAAELRAVIEPLLGAAPPAG